MQKLKDFMLRLQSEKRMKVAVIVVLAAVALLFILPSGPKRTGRQLPRQEPQKPALQDKDSYIDLMQRLTPELEQQRARIGGLEEKIAQTNQKIDQNAERVAQIFQKLMEKMAPQTQAASTGATGDASLPPPPSAVDIPDLGNSMNQPAEMESIGVDQQDVAPPVKAGPDREALIGAGDSVRIKLLAGVNAPTDGTPYPVVMKLTSDVYGPDGSALPLGEARLIAAAQGSITDARALFRLTSLNLRMPDGRRIVKRVDGWVVGEDGIRGLAGVLIDPLGKAIGGAMLAGGVQGFGAGLEANNVTMQDSGILGLNSWSVTGNPWEYAIGRSIREGANEWGDIIKERVRTMVPVVQVLSGREATAVFAKSVSIRGLYESLMNGADESME